MHGALLFAATCGNLIYPCDSTSQVTVSAGGQLSIMRRAHRSARGEELAADLSAAFEQAARQASKNVTGELLRSFRVCTPCQHFERLGEQHDGGYLTCMDDLKRGSLVEVLSVGVEHRDKWSEDTAELLHVPVMQLDCTVDRGSSCERCQFFRRCLRRSDGGPDAFAGRSWTLEEALNHTMPHGNHVADRSLLMKMDIEGGEWTILSTADIHLLRKFRQLVVEFHSIGDESQHQQYLEAMRRLAGAGFTVAHLHGNNFAGEFVKGTDHIPDVLEVTFVSGQDHKQHCRSDEVVLPQDSSNNPWGENLRLAHLT